MSRSFVSKACQGYEANGQSAPGAMYAWCRFCQTKNSAQQTFQTYQKYDSNSTDPGKGNQIPVEVQWNRRPSVSRDHRILRVRAYPCEFSQGPTTNGGRPCKAGAECVKCCKSCCTKAWRVSAQVPGKSCTASYTDLQDCTATEDGASFSVCLKQGCKKLPCNFDIDDTR